MKHLSLFILLFLSFSHLVFAQTQTVRGQILDKQAQSPLPGASVVIVGTDPIIGTTTDTDGYYELKNVPIGRQTVKITFVGYLEQSIPNVVVTTGKEVQLNLLLEEQIISADEVVIVAEKDKTLLNNDMATVSSRGFTIEETSRYAGSRNDPSRMASNFAGVSGANDARNDIVIRGNSPSGLLWRLEGIDIPSPNHYGSLGTTGGPVSILNNNVLANSDFMTGAFPAEYGNANAGVFDLKLRRGNNSKREYLFQIGFAGFEAGVEGPFSKNSKATYIANYRYSTLAVFSALGIPFGTGDAVPYYQDLSFKIDIPSGKKDKFSLFGIGGISRIDLLGSDQEKPDPNDNFGDINADARVRNAMGVVGISHTHFYNPNTYSEITLAVSGMYDRFKRDSLGRNDDGEVISKTFDNAADFNQTKYSLRVHFNKKLNARNTFSLGIIGDLMQMSLTDSILSRPIGRFIINNQFEGNSSLIRGYAQWQHRFNEKLTLNLGGYYQQFLLNNTTAIEPRLGLKYAINNRQSLSLGIGFHSQMQPLPTYFQEQEDDNGNLVRSNKDLDFTRAFHAVVAYDFLLSENLRLKAETYYQSLWDAPVENFASSFSLLNFGADFGFPTKKNLVNEGVGYNYGVEFTLEKFYSNDYYFLITTSLFDSKYKGSDDIERNTVFNGNYVGNILLGKEFKVRSKNAIFVDTKLTVAGGRRETPIDLEASRDAGYTIFDEEDAFSKQYPTYLRWDFKIGYRINAKRMTHEFFADVQNVLNRENVLNRSFNRSTGEISEVYQLGLFPVIQYKLTF
jgi:CarboxypepD_reg-like domain